MSGWSEQQIELINDGYWLGRTPPCPRCGARVEVNPSREPKPPVQMFAWCRACGNEATFMSVATPGAAFSNEQLEELVDRFYRGLGLQCPHDGTVLEFQENETLSPTTHYWAMCPRCGADGQTERTKVDRR